MHLQGVDWSLFAYYRGVHKRFVKGHSLNKTHIFSYFFYYKTQTLFIEQIEIDSHINLHIV